MKQHIFRLISIRILEFKKTIALRKISITSKVPLFGAYKKAVRRINSYE